VFVTNIKKIKDKIILAFTFKFDSYTGDEKIETR